MAGQQLYRHGGMKLFIISFVKTLARDEYGVAAIEYGLVVGGLFIAIAAITNNIGFSLSRAFHELTAVGK